MNIEQGIYGLKFDHDLLSYQEIQPISIFDQQILITHGAKFLFLKFKSSQREFISQGTLIRRFQQARPQLTVNLNGRANNLLCKYIGIHKGRTL